jgi:methylglutaconyl-CoA hydratase
MHKVLFNLSHNNTVANIILNQPKTYNALDLDMMVQLKKYFQEISIDQNIKLLIITANGDHFSTGGDLNWMQNAINYTKEENFQDVENLAAMFLELYNLNKPVICAVQGNIYGGGLGFVACSDIVIAANNSKFCFSEVRLGLAPAIISEFVLPVMNFGFAKYSMLTAKPFNVEQACNFGLVHEIVEAKNLTQAVADNINNILSLDFNAIIIAKKLLRNKEPKVSLEKLYSCMQTIADLRVKPEAQLLIKRFLHKKIN